MNKDARTKLANCFFRRKYSPSIELMDEIISLCSDYYLDEAIYEIKCNTDPCADITEAIKAIEALKD